MPSGLNPAIRPLGSGTLATPAAPPDLRIPGQAPTALRIDSRPEGISKATGGFRPDPVYPDEARVERLTGQATIWIRIAADGRISSAELKKSSGHAVLDRAALEVVKRRWRFPPGTDRFYEWDCMFTLPAGRR